MIYRFLLSVSLVFVLTETSVAQDLIVRIYGDTIRGIVEKEDQRFVYYQTLKSKKGETELISLKEVSAIIYDADNAQGRKLKESRNSSVRGAIQISMQTGFSLILGEDDLYGEDFELIYDELRFGPVLDARVNYFLREDLGLGIVYSTSQYESVTDVAASILVLPDSVLYTGAIDHDRRMNYYGLNLAFKNENSNMNLNYQVDIGLGLITLEDNGTFIENYRLNSSGVGGHISGTVQLGLGQGFYLPLMASLKGFNLNEFTITPSAEMPSEIVPLLEEVYNSLDAGITAMRFQLSLGLGFSF